MGLEWLGGVIATVLRLKECAPISCSFQENSFLGPAASPAGWRGRARQNATRLTRLNRHTRLTVSSPGALAFDLAGRQWLAKSRLQLPLLFDALQAPF